MKHHRNNCKHSFVISAMGKIYEDNFDQNVRWPMGVTAQKKTSRHKHKLSRHKQKLYGTNINFTAQTNTLRHKHKLSRHKRNLHGTNETLTAEVIFAAEVNVTSVFTRAVTQSLEIWRNRWNPMTTLSWEKKTRIAKKASFAIIF